jgi:hypothetical protein
VKTKDEEEFEAEMDRVANEPTMLMWTHTQQCWHTGPLSREMEVNRRMYLRGGGCTDFITIGIFETYEEVDAAIQMLEAVRANGGLFVEV